MTSRLVDRSTAEGERRLVEVATEAVAATLEAAGTFSCVLGCRLLVDSLIGLDLAAKPVSAVLWVYDPLAATGGAGTVLRIGGNDDEWVTQQKERGFNGHLVVCTRGVADLLADPSHRQVPGDHRDACHPG
jgi:hypothetical protein